jgi:hypothetical protein
MMKNINLPEELMFLCSERNSFILCRYARLNDKHTFAVKKLDLRLLGRCFGINSTGGKMKTYNPKAKDSHLEALRKKRKVESVKKLQVS